MVKVAVISPFSPGGTSSFCVCAVVQPHEAFTDLKWTGVLPTFSYLKCATACLSLNAGCNSTEVCSHVSSARAPWARALKTKIPVNFERVILALVPKLKFGNSLFLETLFRAVSEKV